MPEKETDPVPNFASKINLPVDPPSSISPLSSDFSEWKLREREKKKTRVSSSAINPNGPFSRPLVASLDYVVPYSLSERTHHPPLPSPPRVSANAWIHEIRGGIQAQASRFLGSVPAPYKLPSLWHPVFTFFSISRSLLSLFDGRTRRRTAIITTMTDSDDQPTNHVNTTNNNKNDRPGSEAWRYRNSHRGHRGREWGQGRRGTASGARNSRAERGESFVFRNYERTEGSGGPRVTENGRGTFSIKPIITNSMGIWPVYGRRVRSPRRRN